MKWTERGGELIWEVSVKGYEDPRMQAICEHTVTAELAHAAYRARVLTDPATVYMVTNEPCPALWFAEMAFADEILDLPDRRRSDYEGNYQDFEATARKLLDVGGWVSGADVSRSLGRDPNWDKRYWKSFREELGDAFEGNMKLRWKDS